MMGITMSAPMNEKRAETLGYFVSHATAARERYISEIRRDPTLLRAYMRGFDQGEDSFQEELKRKGE
jgi:hypothetical protein